MAEVLDATLTPGKVGIYICGLTTQAPPHLGHVRFAVAFDVLRRWLVRGHGYDVGHHPRERPGHDRRDRPNHDDGHWCGE